MRDIKDHRATEPLKESERSFREQSEALEVERTNLQKIFDSAQVSMLLIDENAKIKRVNQMQLVEREDVSNILGSRLGDGMCCVHAICEEKGCGHAKTCPECPILHICASFSSRHNRQTSRVR